MRFFAVLIAVVIGLSGCAKNKVSSDPKASDFVKPGKAPKAAKTKPAPKTEAKTATATVKPAAPTASAPAAGNKPVITPADENVGRVAMVNASAKFAVLTFPLGNIPAPGQQLSLYRNGLKVAEVKVTGPQRDVNTVADVIAGDAQLDDEVRRE